MGVVNPIDIKSESIENCVDFTSKLSQRFNWHVYKFDNVRVIFDRYDVKCLSVTEFVTKKQKSFWLPLKRRKS